MPTETRMPVYDATLDLAAAAALIADCDGPILVVTHAKPDGDAFGSVIALTAALRTLGRDVTACFAPPVPASLLDLAGSDLARIYEPAIDLGEPVLRIVLDTGAYAQLGPLRDAIEPHVDRTLILDHHLSGDIPARHRYIDGGAAATCEIVADLLELLLDDRTPGHLTRVIREALFVGIASDTGWFRFSNTSPRTHTLAARLLREGVDQAALYEVLEQTERPQKLALLTRALDSLKLVADGRAAIMTLRADDFTETGALMEETERLIDVPQQVGTIRVIALLSEHRQPDGKVVTRMSFRSKPGAATAAAGGVGPVNVAELAGRFGGGGHARAAGARVTGPPDAIVPRLEQALADALTHASRRGDA
ncbi:MAG: DHH family phosphoesterase [Phycisphaeraceae bacterium]